MATGVRGCIDELIGSLESGDYPAFRRPAESLAVAGPRAGPAELSAATTRLAPSIPQLASPFTKTAVFAGARVEWGGSPLPLAELTPARVARCGYCLAVPVRPGHAGGVTLAEPGVVIKLLAEDSYLRWPGSASFAC